MSKNVGRECCVVIDVFITVDVPKMGTNRLLKGDTWLSPPIDRGQPSGNHLLIPFKQLARLGKAQRSLTVHGHWINPRASTRSSRSRSVGSDHQTESCRFTHGQI